LGLITKVDRAAMVTYCLAWRELCETTKDIEENGRTYDHDGLIKANPAVQMQRDAMNQVRKSLTEFGLSPASRAKLSVEPTSANSPKSKLTAFVGSKKSGANGA
jgi:P27 family predicted phage terminase small subunit